MQQEAVAWFHSIVCNTTTAVSCAFEMGLARSRASSFLSGFGLASVLLLYQVRRDVLNSHAEVKDEAVKYRYGLEVRLASLEALLADKSKQ